MPTTTTTYSFNKPVVGADEDDWGGYLNGNWDSVDDLLDGTTPVTGIDINSGTLDGVTIGGTTAGAGTFTTLTANTSITGTLATAAQPNITSVGSLTSLDVAGTLTSDGLTVEGSDFILGTFERTLPTGGVGIELKNGDNNSWQVTNGGDEVYTLRYVPNGGSVVEYFSASSGGDISFYEDTGTTAKFFWDASAESLGIGTTSPSEILEVASTGATTAIEISAGEPSTTTGEAKLVLRSLHSSSGTSYSRSEIASLGVAGGDSDLIFRTTTTSAGPVERMRINSSGNVGIGTSSPSSKLEVSGQIEVSTDTTTPSGGNAYFYKSNVGATVSGFNVAIETGSLGSRSEAMRIDSSGNLLVGTTSNTIYSTSSEVGSQIGDGYIAAARAASVAYLNRLTTDGDIVEFRKDGTTVGSIGSYTSLPYIGKSDVTLLFDPSGPHIIPRGTNGGARDAAINLGASSNRFKDLYLSGGVYLGGTGSANKLDDYERGEHSPTGSNAAGDASFTYDARHGGHYVKVGAMVTYYFRFETDSVTAGTANSTLRISLPFVVSGDDDGSTASEMGGGHIFYHGNNGTGVAVSAKVGNSYMNVRTAARDDSQMNSDDLAAGFNVLQGVVHFYTES